MDAALKSIKLKSFSLKNSGVLVIISLLLIYGVLKLATPYMATATLAYCLLVAGVLFRENTKIHAPLMISGMLVDISLVGVLEIQRSAIATAMGGTLNLFQMGHIALSLCAVLLYIPTVAYGTKTILSPTKPSKKTHLYLGRAAFLFRTGGFILMFSLLSQVKK